MDFKSMLTQLSQLSEATKETEKGRIHKAEPGGYGRKFDTDDEGDEKKGEKKEPAVKRGRGRPKKGADSDTGQVAKYDNAKALQSFMIGNVPKKSKDLEKLPKKKHSLKEWVQEVEQKYVAEAVPPGMKPMAILDPKNQSAGAGVITSTNPTIQKMLGNLDPKDTKVVMTTQQPPQQQQQQQQQQQGQTAPAAAGATGQAPAGQAQVKEKWAGDAKIHATGQYSGKSVEELKSMLAKLKKSGPHPEGSPEAKKQRQINFALRAKGGWKKGEGAAQKESMSEGDIPSDQVDMGAGLGAGRSQATFEGAKPDFLDLDKDGNKKESMKKAAEDKKKKKVDEGMEHKLKSARHTGKAHALAKEGYNCRYDDMEEARAYHEGYKEGLDECYGQGVFAVEETAPVTPPATTGGMAQQAAAPTMEDEMGEGNAFTAALARTPKGGKFSVGGKTFTDRTNYDSKLDEFTFESLDKQLDALLNEDAVSEGMTVSISKGQQGMPDTVSVSAQDGEADALLSLIKQAGLGLFGGEEHSGYGVTKDSGVAQAHGDIDVVGDHDGMMSLIKKVTGAEEGHSEDYADEEGHEEHDHEETCDACGKAPCGCDDEEEMVDEVESYDQEEEEVAEDTPTQAGDEEEEETSADEEDESKEDQALAQADDEEQVTEWANDAGKNAKDFDDESFKTDIDFMTKVISGGLNKQKSTGQTTIPVIAGQKERMVAHESISDWKKLAGLK